MFLGSKVKDLKGQEFSAYGSSQEDGGVAIMIVPPRSFASKIKLKEMDLIQKINGTKIKSIKDLQAFLSSDKLHAIDITLLRDQQIYRLKFQTKEN